MARKRRGVYARDVDQLHVIFAVVAIGCLASVVWMIWDDYAREWKRYQRQFRVIETEVTRLELEHVEAQIDQRRLTALRQQRDEAERALEARRDAIRALEQRLDEVGTRLELATQELQFARSIYDARRWEYEDTAHEPGRDASQARARMEAAAERVRETEQRVEELTLEQGSLRQQLDEARAELESVELEIAGMTRDIDRLQRRLDELRFDWVYYVRNAPIFDAFNPSLRIQQVVLEDLYMDLNFATAPRVDRCHTCHLGIDNDIYGEQQQPFTSHPRLDLFVSDTSPHPLSEFGCTVCHFGKGRATSFYSAVHTPTNESERERWRESLEWGPVELWEWPMRPSYEIEASCLKCHMDETWMPQAPVLEYGLELIENLGCFGCHAISRYEGAREVGPSLEHIVVKTTPEWALKWVMDPKGFRPDTPMPRFFGLANSSDDYWQRRNRVEADAIVAYIFAAATPIDLEPAPPGNPERGEDLVHSVGCLGCHIVAEPGSDGYPEDEPRFTGYRHQGPNLYGIGSKVNARWLYNWVRNPEHYWPDTVMPNLRLSRREAADVTAYLMSLRKPEWEELPPPGADAELRDEVVLEYLRGRFPSREAEQRLQAMGEEEKRRWLGEQLIGRYGCFGCHAIPGFEGRGRIGVELSEWGSKPIARLDFGLLDLPHERRAWLEQKLRTPRSFDEGKVKEPQELLRMPSFELTSDEIDAIATAILGHTDEEIPVTMLPPRRPRRVALEAGRQIVDRYNCRGCHIVEGRGGAIREAIADRLVEREQMTRPAAFAFAPPNLRTEGAKVQPGWLYRFLRNPETIRPWLRVRMPTFSLTDEELNALTRYFAALDDVPYPFEEEFSTDHRYPAERVRAGRQLAEGLRCFQCHVRGEVNPPGTPDTWAPDMAMAASRLRHDWLLEWLADPQSVMPGTRMPQFYPDLSPGRGFFGILDNDPRRQIEALAAYVMSIGR